MNRKSEQITKAKCAHSGARIRKSREKLGLSQLQLGVAIGVDQTTVSNWEIERHGMSAANAIALSRTLKKSINYLMEQKS